MSLFNNTNNAIGDMTLSQLSDFINRIVSQNYNLPGGMTLTDLAVKNLSVEGDFNFSVAYGTHVSMLGEGQPGKFGLINAGGDYVVLSWDNITNKWITSPVTGGMEAPTAAGITTAVTTYTILLGMVHSGVPWRVYDTAGLKFQTRYSGVLGNSAAGTASSVVAFYSYNVGAGAVTSGDTSGTAITHSTTTATFRDTGWVDVPGSVGLADWLEFYPVLKSSIGTDTVSLGFPTILYRWSSK